MTTISPRQGTGPFSCGTGAVHGFVLRRFIGHFIEVEDLHFNDDSAVLLASYRDTDATCDETADAQDDGLDSRITALALLAAVFEHVRDEPGRWVLVTGHTDRRGSDSSNATLSQKRADNVLTLLRGDKDAWVGSCLEQHKVEDHQQFLKWMFEDHGWDTNPGAIDNELGPSTRRAIERFKERFNEEFGQAIAVDEQFDKAAWEAFYDVYERELSLSLGWIESDLDTVRQALQLVGPGAVGCGESWPTTEQNRSRVDRRVEIMLFDPGEEPVTPLACHPTPGQCQKDDCELRKPQLYELQPLPVAPVLAPRFRVPVHLRMFWKDPGGIERPLPRDLPVQVKFGDGRPGIEVRVRDDGHLFFIADKRSVSFSFEIRHDEVSFLASAPASTPEPERLVPETEVAALVRDGWRVFRLPATWGPANCEFRLDATMAPTYIAPDFTALNTVDTIGTAATPCPTELLPHWQYIKMLYFDRALRRRLSLPPMLLEGFFDGADSSGMPATQSNWLTESEACQALPWILRKKDDGSALTTPDRNTLLRLRTKPNTFIDSSGTSRKLVTESPGAASDDVGLNVGADFAFDVTQPSGKRLAYYDLPPLWLSRAYFCRLSGGRGAPVARQGKYEDLAAEPTSDATPLLFSLDDIVLCTLDASGVAIPIAWAPDAQPLNRVALFSNTFSSGTNLSSVGLYKPDTGNSQPYFTQRPAVETTRNYIADYPDWTRLVITQGNAFDVFDQRVRIDPGGVVGARAAIRHVDATVSPNFVQHKGLHRTGVLDPRPSATDRPFMSIQPMYEQRHHQWWARSRTADRGIGRVDLVLLRCSDVDADGTTEIARCLSYFRFFFDFNATFESRGKNPPTPLGLTGRAAKWWTSDAITNLLRRWNGPDGPMNRGPATLAPRPAGLAPLRATTLWFAQELPATVAHYQIGVFRDPFRAYMAARIGRGALQRSGNTVGPHGRFTFAHEVGHGASLHDEYVEKTTRLGIRLSAARLEGFDCYSPGSPYARDTETMMNQNMKVDARDHWHLAEWMRERLGGGIDFEVQHDTHSYFLPHHAETPAKNYICWPLREDIDRVVSGRRHSRFDAFIYPLGDERWASIELPTRVRNATPFDGILVIVVKLRFDFHIPFTTESRTTTSASGRTVITAATTDSKKMHDFLVDIRNQIRLRFCNRYYVTGSVAGHTFTRALLEFSPRFWVRNPGQNYSKEDPRGPNDHHIEIDMKATGTPAWDSGLFIDDHELEFAYDQHPSMFATKFFSEMVGVTPATHTTANAYDPIIQGVLPGGRVHAI